MINRSAKDGPMRIMDQSSGTAHNSKASEKCVLGEMACANYAFGKILRASSANAFHHSARSLRADSRSGICRQTKGSSVFPDGMKKCEALKHAHGDLLTPAFSCSCRLRCFDLPPVAYSRCPEFTVPLKNCTILIPAHV